MLIQVSVVTNNRLFSGIREVPDHKIAELPDDMDLRTAVVGHLVSDLLADKIQEALVDGYGR